MRRPAIVWQQRMNTRRLSQTVALLGLSTLLGASAARACKYCWAAEQAGADYAQQTMLPSGQPDTQSGAFPLDGTISQFKPAAAPTALATPPPAGSVVTDAAGLRVAVKAPAAPAPAPVQVAIAKPSPVPVQTVAAAPVPPKSGHYADAGLLGLAAAGGVFCWRTRRKTDSAR